MKNGPASEGGAVHDICRMPEVRSLLFVAAFLRVSEDVVEFASRRFRFFDRSRKGRCGFRLCTGGFNHLLITLRRDAAHVHCSPTGARRDQTADDHVLFQTDQFIPLALNRSLGQHARGFLERCGRDERPGLQAGLGDPQKDRLTGCRTTAFRHGLVVGSVEFGLVHMLALQQRGGAESPGSPTSAASGAR